MIRRLFLVIKYGLWALSLVLIVLLSLPIWILTGKDAVDLMFDFEPEL